MTEMHHHQSKKKTKFLSLLQKLTHNFNSSVGRVSLSLFVFMSVSRRFRRFSSQRGFQNSLEPLNDGYRLSRCLGTTGHYLDLQPGAI